MKTRLALTVTLVLLFAGGAAAAVLLATGNDGEPTPAYRGSTPPARIKLADFALRDHTGTPVRSDDTKGKVVLLTFLDTQCTSSCPIIATQIGLALDRLARAELADVVPVAITSDPPGDTPSSIRSFLRRHNVEGRLHYLTGTVAELRPVWDAFQVAVSYDTGDDTLHSAPVRIYDRSGIWASTLHTGADLTPDNLAHDLRTALADE